MKRRFMRAGLFIFALVWLVVLSVPQLRQMLLVQLRDGNPYPRSDIIFSDGRSQIGDYAAAPFGLDARLEQLFPREIPFENAARNAPNDARAQLVALVAQTERVRQEIYSVPTSQTQKPPEGHDAGTLASLELFDRVLPRFPRDGALPAARLRMTVRRGVGNRVVPDTPSWARKGQPILTRAQLQRAIAVAQQGQRTEPDNCYFDMALAHFLLADYQDKKAIAVIHTAAKKPRYDDHTSDVVRAQIAFARSQRTLLLEDLIAIQGSMLLPHYAQQRNMANILIQLAQNAERAGNSALALQILGDVAKLGARMRDSDQFIIASLVGISLQATVWQRGATFKRVKNAEDGDAWRLQLAHNFATYARSKNRPDLADEALRDAKINNDLRARIGHYNDAAPLNSQNVSAVANLWWAATAILSQSARTLPVWLVLCLVGYFVRRKHPAETPVRPLDAISIALATSGICVAILLALNSFAGTVLTQNTPFNSNPDATQLDPNTIHSLRQFFDVAPLLMGAVLCFVALVWRNHKANRQAMRAGNAQSVASNSVASTSVASTLLLGATACIYTLGAVVFLAERVPTIHLVFGFALVLILVALGSSRLNQRRAPEVSGPRDAAHGLRKILLFGGLMISYVLLFALVLWRNEDALGFIFCATLALLLVPVLASAAKSVARWSRTPRGPNVLSSYGFRWFRASLGAMIVLSSVAYLALQIASLPRRQTLESYLVRANERGDMFYVRQPQPETKQK